MVRQTRAVPGYTPMPILFNEDDHFDFDKPQNNFIAAIGEYASWGYFDYRMKGEGFDDGYQSVPVNWGISSTQARVLQAAERNYRRGRERLVHRQQSPHPGMLVSREHNYGNVCAERGGPGCAKRRRRRCRSSSRRSDKADRAAPPAPEGLVGISASVLITLKKSRSF